MVSVSTVFAGPLYASAEDSITQPCSISNYVKKRGGKIYFHVIRGPRASEDVGAYFSELVSSPDEALNDLADLEDQGFCKSVVTAQPCAITSIKFKYGGTLYYTVIRGPKVIKDDAGAYFSNWTTSTNKALKDLTHLRHLGLCE